jgi:uncharacterized protein (TIGR03083 family)
VTVPSASPETAGAVAIFASAAHSFAALVHDIPADRWDAPGLGEWDLRALVGHASRSLITVGTYLAHAAEREDVTSPRDYYVQIREYASKLGAADIIERGRQAGRDLGDDPSATVDGLVQRVLSELTTAGNPLIAVIGGLGIRLHAYLPTRTFELVVHGLDIARAVDISFPMPADVLEEATALAAQIAVAEGHGETVLLALTGRAGLPASFSVV